jgi:hypothetical protein
MLLTLLRPKQVQAPPGSDSGPVIRPTLRVRFWYASGGTVTYVDLSDRASAVNALRGRSSKTAANADPGTMTVTLDNSDGLLDPDNTSSALHPHLIPRRESGLIVDHLFEGSYRPLGHGYLDTIDRQWGAVGRWSETVITTVDQSTRLAELIPPQGTVFPAQTAAARIRALARTASRTTRTWVQRSPVASFSIDPSSRVLGQLTADGTTSLWEYMSQAAYADDGLVYFTASGALKFQSGNLRLGNVRYGTLGDGPGEVEVAPDLLLRLSSDDIVNEVAFTNAAGTRTAAVSAAGFYLAEDATGTATMLADGAQVSSRARMVFGRDGVPRRAVDTVTLDVLGGYFDFGLTSPYRFAMDVSISSRVRLIRRPPGGGTTIDADYHVESITHNVVVGSEWKTTLRLSKAQTTETFWRLGVDALGSGTNRLTW